MVSIGRTVQAEGCRPVRGGPVRGVRTYASLIGKAVVRGESGEERSGFFDCTRLRSMYKRPAVEASNIPHCRKAVKAPRRHSILDVFLLNCRVPLITQFPCVLRSGRQARPKISLIEITQYEGKGSRDATDRPCRKQSGLHQILRS